MVTKIAIPSASTRQIPIDQIVPSPYQARKHFDEAALKELAKTMEDRGLQNAIVVRPVNTGFELIAGERRWRAARLLGWKTIEAKIDEVDDKEAALRGMIENVQREDLSAIEQALGYRTLSQPPFSLNQSKIADMVGKDRTLINKYLTVAPLGDHPGGVNRFTPLGLAHLVEICRIDDSAEQADLADQIDKQALSVKEVKSIVDSKIGRPSKVRPTVRKPIKDPMVDTWKILTTGMIFSEKPWGVTYGFHRIPGLRGQPIPCWQFTVAHTGKTPLEDLRKWGLELAQDLKENRPMDPRLENAIDRMAPQTPEEIKAWAKAGKNMRMPKNAREEAELEKLALQGPSAVYEWLFGKNSYYTPKVAGIAWKDLGGPADPIAAVRYMIKTMKEMEALIVEK
jgi:ParB family transcriptional regulator, chromosome partitioning protein